MSELETRLARRARYAFAAAVTARAEAMEQECTAKRARVLNRKEGAARRAYVQALRLADIMSEA